MVAVVLVVSTENVRAHEHPAAGLGRHHAMARRVANSTSTSSSHAHVHLPKHGKYRSSTAATKSTQSGSSKTSPSASSSKASSDASSSKKREGSKPSHTASPATTKSSEFTTLPLTRSRSSTKSSGSSKASRTTSSSTKSQSQHGQSTQTPSTFGPGVHSDMLLTATHEGQLRGYYNETTQVYSWLGVPFGADTSGANRFMSPKRAPSWNGVRDATHFGWSCPQHDSGGSRVAIGLFGVSDHIFDQNTQSEDCLNVNIYVGKNHWERYKKSNGTAKAPVWLNFYGGSYEWGSNRVEFYQGDAIVSRDDVVIVNANFRNWIFGYPLAPQLHPSRNEDNDSYEGGNPGLKDVDYAIEWVHKNIAAFGGDGDQITIGGTSTGACTVDNWAYAHYGKPDADLVKGIILQSGSMTSLGRYFLAPNNDDFTAHNSSWNLVADEVGCGTSNSHRQFACMQQAKWQDVMQASFTRNAPFLLMIDNVTTFNNYYDRLEQRQFVDTPMLIGNNKDEGNAFLLHQMDTLTVAGPVITAEVWVCPASVQAQIRQGVAPTWRYRFSPQLYLPETPDKYRQLLTFHGSDTAYAWGTWPPLKFEQFAYNATDPWPIPIAFPTDNNYIRGKISDSYRGANVAFVKDPQHGLRHFQGGWPEYAKGTQSVGDFGRSNDIHPVFKLISSNDIDALCPLTNAEVNQNNIKYKSQLPAFRSLIV